MPGAIRVDGLIASKRVSVVQDFVRDVLFRGFPTPRATFVEVGRPADACIQALVRELGPAPLAHADVVQLAHDYADQRARLGYDLRALLVELGLLRALLVGTLAGAGAPNDALERTAAFLHDVLVEAALRFAGKTAASSRPFTPAA